MTARTSPDPLFTGETVVRTVDDRHLLPLPEAASAALPSRGQVALDVTLTTGTATTQLVAVAEPDGRRGHWLDLPVAVRTALGVGPGDTVALTLVRREDWPEPEVPDDLASALEDAPDIADTWSDITPMARWEWVRWVGATRSADTRARRVAVSVDKLRSGKRRPCCFDLASCTDPELARSGKLRGLDPS